MKAIYKREFKSYFDSLLGYVFVAFFLVIGGIYFAYYNLTEGYPLFSSVLTSVTIMLVVAIPIISMRCFAEERKTKTDQMLLTAPVTLTQVVLGKYFALVSVFAIPTAIFCTFPLIIKQFGEAYFLIDYTTILAYFLLGCAYIAICMFISSLTESQIMSAVVSFAILLLLHLLSGVASLVDSSATTSLVAFIIFVVVVALVYYAMAKNRKFALIFAVAAIIVLIILYLVNSTAFAGAFPALLESLSLVSYLSNFTYETFDVAAIVLYLTVSCLFTFFTVQSLQKRRYS